MKYYYLLFCFTMSLGCDVNYYPGNLKDTPILKVDVSNISLKSIQDSLINSADSCILRNLAEEEINGFNQTNNTNTEFIIFSNKDPKEYYMIQPEFDKKSLYFKSMTYRDKDGHIIELDSRDLSAKELLRIENKLKIILERN